MTFDEKVEYLESYRDRRDDLIYIGSQMEGLKSINYGPILGTRQSYAQLMAKSEAISDEMAQIENVVNNLEKNKERLVLSYRYFQFMDFKDIAKKINYSTKQTKRFHNRGINNLKI